MSSRISPNKNAVQQSGLTRLPNLVAVSPNERAGRETQQPSGMGTQFGGREIDSKSSTRTTYSTVSTQTERTRKTKT